uniref:MATH domain-containing protein n=1 Tax=Panagrolaimus sp. PS1159 TaxID=55785 RepID=A0AC35FC58_9BILA
MSYFANQEMVAIHNWSFENFSPASHLNRHYLQSTDIKTWFINDGIKWGVKLFPNGSSPKDAGFVTLQIDYNGPLKVNARFAFDVFANVNGKEEKVTVETESETYTFSPEIQVLQISRFISHNALVKYGLLIDGYFKMVTKVIYTYDNDLFGTQTAIGAK